MLLVRVVTLFDVQQKTNLGNVKIKVVDLEEKIY
jgi:hypothetical protein